MLRSIVTGGAGFIGSHIVKNLIERGDYVIVIDNLFTGSLENLKPFLNLPNFEFIEKDVCDPIDIQCDRIYHLACPASPPFYMKDPVHTLETAIYGTHNMLKLAKKYNARMLFTSTSEVYGDPVVHPQPEEYWGNVNPRGPRSCYDEGKRAAETLCSDYVQHHSVWVRTARLFNTYGPNMSPYDGRVVSNLIVQAIQNKDLTIYGNGQQTRSFTFIDDTVRGLLSLIDSEYSGPINIGNPNEFTILEFAELVRKKINPNLNIIYLDASVDDPKQRKPVIEKAKKYLNWEPKIFLNEGLDLTIPYFKSFFEK